jgi:hypothetical protein
MVAPWRLTLMRRPGATVSETRGLFAPTGALRGGYLTWGGPRRWVFGRRFMMMRPQLRALATVPTRSTGPLAPVLLRTAETQVGRAPPMVGSVRGSLKRFDDDLVLGVRGGVIGRCLYRGKPLTYG